jgi:hypothetical protein
LYFIKKEKNGFLCGEMGTIAWIFLFFSATTLKEPLLAPNEDEREVYVPNIVYSCGSIITMESF